MLFALVLALASAALPQEGAGHAPAAPQLTQRKKLAHPARFVKPEDVLKAATDQRRLPGLDASVIGIAQGDQARAWLVDDVALHEILNDTVDNTAIAITG